eukprot:NODE_795_length_4189_cov_0.531785.p2 type:complete len:277 gc:universal NODE_795_length_4189_cov_0.531785:3054-3884(+)
MCCWSIDSTITAISNEESIRNFTKMDILIAKFIKKYDFVGFSGPQGLGKSTVSAKLDGAVVLGLDDFYFPFDKLQELKMTKNPFLQYRGMPGTHDAELLKFSIQALLDNNLVYCPTFNKSLNNGKGDRCGMKSVHKKPGQVLLLEGWCVGFLPTAIPLESWFCESDVEFINSKLLEYTYIWNKMDALIHVKTMDSSNVVEWRYEQEVEKNQGMTRSEIEEFVKMYMPWYSCDTVKLPTLFIVLDKNRNVVHHEEIAYVKCEEFKNQEDFKPHTSQV